MRLNLTKYSGYFLFALLCIISSRNAFGQGAPSSPQPIQNSGVTPSSQLEESLEDKIKRLRQELAEAEQALAASKENDTLTASDPAILEMPIGALVVVEGSNSSGSGFMATIKGRTFFVTNIHVLGDARGAEVRTIDGASLKLGSVGFVSKDRDIAIVPVDWDGPVFKLSPSLSFDKVVIGQGVTVLGNSSGANVATRLNGEIKGIGPDELEVSAKFVPGNSGSPIVHDALGTVIAIASHLKDYTTDSKWSEDSEFNDIRRFGYRLDGDFEWEQVSLENLYLQGETFRRLENRTEAMWNISYMLSFESKLLTSYRDHESIGYLYEDISSDFNWARGTASDYNTRILRRFIHGMMNEVQTDLADADKSLTLHYYRTRYTEIKSYREKIRSNLSRFSETRL